jgi:PAS domain S-box-containing protein
VLTKNGASGKDAHLAKASEEQFEAIANCAKDAILLMDESGKICYWNLSAQSIFGYSQDEVLGKDAFDFLVPKSHRQKFMQQLKEHDWKDEFSSSKATFCVQKKDGDTFPIDLSLSIFEFKNKSYTLGIVRDVTGQKRLEEKLKTFSEHMKSMVDIRTVQLKDANERLLKAERLAAIGELAGMIGHDLRNPLTGIKAATYYIRKKNLQNLDASGKEMLEVIDKDIDHANKIINDLLEYSKDLRLEIEEITPKKMLADALSTVKVPENIKVVDSTLDEPRVYVDLGKMHRLLVNLIKNAFDAMPCGGTLEIKSVKNGANLDICVSDTGVGIDSEIMGKLFTPLFTTKAQGMGFGLPICKRIAEAHKGKIVVESEVGKGTLFTVTFPISAKPKNKNAENLQAISETPCLKANLQ